MSLFIRFLPYYSYTFFYFFCICSNNHHHWRTFNVRHSLDLFIPLSVVVVGFLVGVVVVIVVVTVVVVVLVVVLAVVVLTIFNIIYCYESYHCSWVKHVANMKFWVDLQPQLFITTVVICSTFPIYNQGQ